MNKITSFLILLFIVSNLRAEVYNVVKLGADASGKEKSTDIINGAIQKAAENGGGTIYFPAGNYQTGPIHLESNITLDLEAGAHIQFSDDFDDFLPYTRVRFEGYFMNTFSPLIYAVGAKNIAIKGEGTMDGNGKYWWAAQRQTMGFKHEGDRVVDLTPYQEFWAAENAELVGTKYEKEHFFRPPFIQFIECENVDIEGITIMNSPFWTVNPVACNDVRVHGITISNPHDGYNTDGINPSSCSNVRISDCFISVGDDCVTIKSGRDEFGRNYGKPSENITVTNCVMLSGHGGVVIGSEMSGGVKNVTISNCVFDGTDNGIRLKSARGRGGVVENIRVNNIVMRDIKNTAFIFNLFYDKGTSVEPVTERTPIFRNIHISDVTGVDINQAGALTGIEEMPVEEISLTNINLKAERGFIAQTGKNLYFSNIDIATEIGPSMSFTDCHELVLDNVRSGKPIAGEAIVEINSSTQVLINNCFQMVPADVFAKISGSKVTKGTNYLGQVKQPFIQK
ncbi:glycoside hydrolase family 28 protein [Maribellus sediminis]|uniref:glycoside hydrolase family 28 protein n=1 Tax=Maribellus sediminis TaxID=2696285 RepID=UPI00142F5980|nr:glycoside hydrolase family 28 protein [Maribellus sediminis]